MTSSIEESDLEWIEEEITRLRQDLEENKIVDFD
jgi:hypothetical protein